MNRFDEDLALAQARESFAELSADVVELRARRLCREAEPHGTGGVGARIGHGRVPCPDHVVEARRQLGKR